MERCSHFLRGPRFPKGLLAVEPGPAIIDLTEISMLRRMPLAVPFEGHPQNFHEYKSFTRKWESKEGRGLAFPDGQLHETM